MTALDDAFYLNWLVQACGYKNPRPIEGGKAWAAIQPLMFTHAIIVGVMGDRSGYENRWCYDTYAHAQEALEAWDPSVNDEPEGWHRHPLSGRRRAGVMEYVAP